MQTQDIYIRQSDPFFSTLPVFIWGPFICGKLSALKNMLLKRNFEYHVINGYGYKSFDEERIMVGMKIWMDGDYMLIMDDFWLSEKSVSSLCGRNPEELKRIFVVADIMEEENIPPHVKANFQVVSYKEIEAMDINPIN